MTSCVHGSEYNIVTVHSIQSNLYKFNTVPSKIPMACFTEKEKTILKFIWDPKNTVNSQSNLEKEEQSRRHHTS